VNERPIITRREEIAAMRVRSRRSRKIAGTGLARLLPEARHQLVHPVGQDVQGVDDLLRPRLRLPGSRTPTSACSGHRTTPNGRRTMMNDHYGYASERHDHDDYAGRHHRHYDDESTAAGLREDLSRAEERIRDLETRIELVSAALNDHGITVHWKRH
jgi:hypothetical protein